MDQKTSLFEKMGGRKFIMGLFIIGVGALIEVHGKSGLSTNMVGLLSVVFATFSGANALITAKNVGKTAEEAEQSAPAPAELPNEIATQMAQTLNQIGAALNTLQEGLIRNEQAIQGVQQSLATSQKAISAILARNNP